MNSKSISASSNTMIAAKTILRCKCVILGNQGVGKSAIAQVFHSDGTQYPKNYNMTVNAEVSVKVVNIPDSNVSIELFLHDIAGHEVFLEYSTKYCEGASVFLIVYDVTNPDSFAAASRWLQIAKRSKLVKGMHGALVANKVDLEGRRVVSSEQGEEFAKANKLTYFECSAFYYLSNSFYDHFEASIKSFSKIDH
ncbi:P-loop containing nucleoside triphosphate hydrolase protein [Obelidium mucronatum]|nr:P-loop containing nucleoside triphosphate hydrolase protein [Obelidium mucronatum]